MKEVATFAAASKDKLDFQINDFIKTTKAEIQCVSLSRVFQPVDKMAIFSAMVLYKK